MYKRLFFDDFTTDYMSVIEPAGAASDGTLVLNTDYKEYAFNVNTEEFEYRQLANIIKGDITITPFDSKFPNGGIITVITVFRKNFKESIHPSSFSSNGVKIKSGSNDVEFCESGRVYRATDDSYYLYPDIGIAIKGSLSSFGTIKACSEETKTISQAHIYASPSEFNYTTNPSFLDKNDNIRFPTYDRFNGPYNSNREDWINNPVVYITTIGFYNDNGDLLAVAKLPKPFKKDSTTAFHTTVEFKF